MSKQTFQEGDLVKLKNAKNSSLYKISYLAPNGLDCDIKAVADGTRAGAQRFDTSLLVKVTAFK